MTNLPPRKGSSSIKSSRQDFSPLQILLQMGFSKHRALKALAATGHRSVQLASDWLLTHVNDSFIDTDEPREYILYASPTGPLLTQLLDFWEKSKAATGWNGAHNFPPHITLVSFFKAPDETSLQLAKAVKYVVESVGGPPTSPLKLEPYISHNFMGLFVSEEHADYLKRIAVQYVKQVSSALGVTMDTYEHLDVLGTCFPWCTIPQQKPFRSINLEPHVKSLHITLAYHFEESAYEALKIHVDQLQPLNCEQSSWDLRLYSRDPRFVNHQVYKVTQGYTPTASDELELVIGDYIYIEQKELESSTDGWVQGTSWLTGISGYLPAIYTRCTAESDAWTLHRAISLGNNNNLDSKSESDSATDNEMSWPHEDAAELGLQKSEENYKEWDTYWSTVSFDKNECVFNVQGTNVDLTVNGSERFDRDVEQQTEATASGSNKTEANRPRRWFFAMRHGERVDLTYGQWVQHCFDQSGNYVRKDLNMPLHLSERAGGKEAYCRDTPLTRMGRMQAQLVGEALRLAGVPVRHVYSSAALRCVETAHAFLEGLQADPSVKIRVEPGLFEYKFWHLVRGITPFMTLQELHNAGLNVDLEYKPYLVLDIESPETVEEFYKRNENIMHSVVNDTEEEGGNVLFVGHASTLDLMVVSLKRLADPNSTQPYELNKELLNRVSYCAVGAVRDKPWQVVTPPCPPFINSSSGRFNWKMLLDVWKNYTTTE